MNADALELPHITNMLRAIGEGDYSPLTDGVLADALEEAGVAIPRITWRKADKSLGVPTVDIREPLNIYRVPLGEEVRQGTWRPWYINEEKERLKLWTARAALGRFLATRKEEY